jgi:hypothetical protein
VVLHIAAVVYVAEGVGAVLAGLAASFPVWKHFKSQRIEDQRLRDAILGVVGTHGLPSTPSVFQQIATLSTAMVTIRENVTTLTETVDTLTGTVEDVKASTNQLKPNGGSSLADTVNKIAADLSAHIIHSQKAESDIWNKLKEISSGDKPVP